MDRVDLMRSFVETVRAGGFSAAARALDLPRSTVSKHVQALEQRLGVQLLMRTTRSIHLTGPGAAFYESAPAVLASLDEAEAAARDGATGVRGALRINCPASFGNRVLAPVLARFHAAHPDIQLQVALSDQLVDPVRGGFDVTLRIAALQDSSLAARVLMPARRVLVASPAWIAREGRPRTPAELASRPFLCYGNLQGGIMLALTRRGDVQRIRVRGPLIADNGDFLAEMAEAGLGVALVPTFIVADALRERRLVTLLPDWQPPPIAVHALFPAARPLPRRTRLFVDFVAKAFAQRSQAASGQGRASTNSTSTAFGARTKAWRKP